MRRKKDKVIHERIEGPFTVKVLEAVGRNGNVYSIELSGEDRHRRELAPFFDAQAAIAESYPFVEREKFAH
jgi:hypothetical protein